MTAAALVALVAECRRVPRGPALEPTTHFGLSGGLNIPLSDLSRQAQTGYIIDGMVQGTPQGFPVALRGELSYTGFAGKSHQVSQNITSLGVNAVLPLMPQGDAPYFIGGVTLNHVSTFAGLSSENDFGFNFGGGVQWDLGDMRTFAELRYMYVAHSGASRQMLPLTFRGAVLAEY